MGSIRDRMLDVGAASVADLTRDLIHAGYLGQFLVKMLLETPDTEVHYTYTSPTGQSQLSLPGHKQAACGHRVSFESGQGLHECLQGMGEADLVVNCAAISAPATCEKEPERALAINAPSALVDALVHQRGVTGREPLLVHISTDHVYGGSRSWWSEEEAGPINAYGRSKVAGEELVLRRWRNSVVLRPSLIFGPPPPFFPVSRNLFLQWMEGQLAKGVRWGRRQLARSSPLGPASTRGPFPFFAQHQLLLG